MTAPSRFAIGAVLAGGLVLLPILALLYVAISPNRAGLLTLASASLADTLFDTGLLLIGVGAGTSLIGFASAWIVSAYRFPGRGFVQALLVLPLAVPTYLAAYIMVELLDVLGPVQSGYRKLFGYSLRGDYWFPPIRSLPGAVFVFSFVLYPYVYLPVRAILAWRSSDLSEVARTLGADAFAQFWRVVAPLARPALIAGVTLALMETLNDLGAAEYLGVQTFTVSLFDLWLNRNSLAAAAQLALVALAVVALLIVLENWARRDQRYALPVRRPRLAAGIELTGGRAWLAFLLCLLPPAIGFCVPALYLLAEAGRILARDGLPPNFIAQVAATASFATAAGLLVLALGFAAVMTARMAPARQWDAAKRLACLGYAMPGTVLALGMLIPLAGLDDAITRLLRDGFGLQPRQVFLGTGAAVVLALTARFLALSISTLDAGLTRVSPRIDEAARGLGADRRRLAGSILLPLLKPSLAAAAILVFVDMIKELPATLLLRPLGVDTLATALYGHAARARFEDGAIQALLILAISLLPVIRLAALVGRDREEESARANAGIPATI